jgi:hypothetical protein
MLLFAKSSFSLGNIVLTDSSPALSLAESGDMSVSHLLRYATIASQNITPNPAIVRVSSCFPFRQCEVVEGYHP